MTGIEIVAAIEGGVKLIQLAVDAANGARERGELTDEEETRVDAALETMMAQPHWKQR